MRALVERAWWAALLGVALLSPSLLAAQPIGTGAVASVVERLRRSGTIAGVPVRVGPQLLELYQERGFEPLWSAAAGEDLRRAIAGALADGLDPEAYHASALDSLVAARGAGARAEAELDVLRSAALTELVHDLRWGRARPASLALPNGAEDAELVRDLAGSADVAAGIRAVSPRHFVYQGLVAALRRLRGIEESGGWGSVPAGGILREGASDARVLALRVRLAAEGYLPSEFRPSASFDAALSGAVRSFQHHHGLNEDGAVGPSTLVELNAPVGERIADVRVNLERARWITPILPDTFLVVNIAGAKVYVVRAGEIVHEARVIVGKKYTRTPTFASQLRQIDLNPTWTVPASIVDEVLAAVRRDPDYLRVQGFRVLDGDGREAAVGAPELLARANSFPWVLRQDPGPLNPLGRVRFSFPNPHSVYLHDTPARQLFDREERLFSHGCIRVQDPLALAAILIDRPERWTKESLQAAIDAGSTEAIPLRRPVFILIQYWTASTDEHGELHFYRDVYGRDPAVLAALAR